jgi:hypothetical protein
MPIDLAYLQQWIGRSERVSDTLSLTPMAALAATLDRDDPPVASGDALPPLWHWLFFYPCTGSRWWARTGILSAAVSCRRLNCPGGCGQAVSSRFRAR